MSPHLTAEHLEQFRKKQASPKELVRIDRHLGDCPACRDRLASMDAAQDFVSRLVEPAKDEFHLCYEQIEAYTQSLIDDIDRAIVTTHMALSSDCADRLQNLQKFAA